MGGLLEFTTQYSDEPACITALAGLKWPTGFSCRRCLHGEAWQLKTRSHVFECRRCGYQESVTAGTILHKTRTPLRKWFIAAYLMIKDKRGVSAMFLSRELDLRYETAWLLAHKLRHALTERQEFSLRDFVEVDETFYGGRRQKGNRGRGMTANKALIVAAVEKREAKSGRGVRRSGWRAGNARVAVLPAATIDQLGGFIRKHVRPETVLITDGFTGYRGLGEYRHIPIVQGSGKNAEQNQPLVHLAFSNIKTWLNGTHHGVSAKHLPRYLREWNYRFNRRANPEDRGTYLLRRATSRATITYGELVAGAKPEGATDGSIRKTVE